jgi:hypothetical protein
MRVMGTGCYRYCDPKPTFSGEENKPVISQLKVLSGSNAHRILTLTKARERNTIWAQKLPNKFDLTLL